MLSDRELRQVTTILPFDAGLSWPWRSASCRRALHRAGRRGAPPRQDRIVSFARAVDLTDVADSPVVVRSWTMRGTTRLDEAAGTSHRVLTEIFRAPGARPGTIVNVPPAAGVRAAAATFAPSASTQTSPVVGATPRGVRTVATTCAGSDERTDGFATVADTVVGSTTAKAWSWPTTASRSRSPSRWPGSCAGPR